MQGDVELELEEIIIQKKKFNIAKSTSNIKLQLSWQLALQIAIKLTYRLEDTYGLARKEVKRNQ